LQSERQANPQKNRKSVIHLGTFDCTGKDPGTYLAGLVKLYPNAKEDLLDSAKSFLKAADRCLNGCKVEEGNEMLIVPGTVCASFSCELFLKYILLVEKDEEAKGHGLADLFLKCSEDVQSELVKRETNILKILERNNTQFVNARYHHEKASIAFRHQELLRIAELLSGFVTERYPNEKT